MMTSKRTLYCGAGLLLLLLSQANLRAQNAVNVTVEAADTTLAVGERTTITVYAQIDASIAAGSDQVFSWYIDVLNANGGVVAGYGDVQTPACDNTPAISGDGTLQGANLRGIFDTFLNRPGAGKGSRVVLVQFEVTALAEGEATFTVAPGGTGSPLDDFLVEKTGGGSYYSGGNYSAASVAITVGGGVVDPSSLNLTVVKVGNQANLTFDPLPGFNHTVQFSDTLLAPSWVALPGAPHNSGVVNQEVTGIPRRFYRVRLTAP